MQQNPPLAAGVAPAPRSFVQEQIEITRRAASHCLGFAAVMYALVGCAGAGTPALNAAAPAHAETPVAVAAPSPARPAVERASTHVAPHDEELPWLSPSHVGAAVRAHHGDFQACQALGDLESSREDGAITVGWLVRPDGGVKDVTVGPTTFRSARINACVLDVAKQVTFPPSAATTNVSWTVKFRGASHAPVAEANLR